MPSMRKPSPQLRFQPDIIACADVKPRSTPSPQLRFQPDIIAALAAIERSLPSPQLRFQPDIICWACDEPNPLAFTPAQIPA